ncbi:MAG: hypothetical protein JO092_11525 [Candidatus Eremiobacteraeota bacterium]|nr:hypothetical protein [Candidatus Eremiobacteraeota bacterium]
MINGRRRLRFVYVTQDDLSRNSGYAFRVDRLRKAIEAAGHTVEVIGFSEAEPRIACTARRTRSRLQRLWPLFQGLVRPADCVIVTSIGAPYNGLYALVMRLLGRRVVYDCHDPVVEGVPRIYKLGILTKPVMRYIAWSEHLLGRLAVATLAAGPLQARELSERDPGRRVFLIYNTGNGHAKPVSPRGIRQKLGWTESTIVVYAGGAQPAVRGIESQIEAVRAARGIGGDVVMLAVVFGNSGFVETLGAALIREGALRIWNNLPREELLAALEECDVAVSSEPWRYGMQSKMFDYIRSGVRIIAVDDDRDIVRTFGSLVQTYDGTIQELARLLADRPARLSPEERRRGLELVASLDRTSEANFAQALATIEE